MHRHISGRDSRLSSGTDSFDTMSCRVPRSPSRLNRLDGRVRLFGIEHDARALLARSDAAGRVMHGCATSNARRTHHSYAGRLSNDVGVAPDTSTAATIACHNSALANLPDNHLFPARAELQVMGIRPGALTVDFSPRLRTVTCTALGRAELSYFTMRVRDAQPKPSRAFIKCTA